VGRVFSTPRAPSPCPSEPSHPRSPESHSDELEAGEFEVDTAFGFITLPSGEPRIMVSWKGYPQDQDMPVAIDALARTAPDVLEEFVAQLPTDGSCDHIIKLVPGWKGIAPVGELARGDRASRHKSRKNAEPISPQRTFTLPQRTRFEGVAAVELMLAEHRVAADRAAADEEEEAQRRTTMYHRDLDIANRVIARVDPASGISEFKLRNFTEQEWQNHPAVDPGVLEVCLQGRTPTTATRLMESSRPALELTFTQALRNAAEHPGPKSWNWLVAFAFVVLGPRGMTTPRNQQGLDHAGPELSTRRFDQGQDASG
jgi:hypothetical protein